MKFARFERDGTKLVGVVDDGEVWPLPAGTDLVDLFGRGLDALLEAGDSARRSSDPVALPDVRLLAPLDPPTIRDFTTFERHVEGMVMLMGGDFPASFYDSPPFYFSNPHAVTGPFDDISMPPGCERLDVELEVGAVIGPAGSNLTVAEARDHIIGYVVFNDWSARDIQSVEMRAQLGPVKGKDTANTIGPWLVTADELGPARDSEGFLDLRLSFAINGEQVGEDSLASGSWTFEQMVVLASRGTWIRPGDLIGSGTVGSGCLAELWGRYGPEHRRPIVVGDRVTMTVEGIGTIENRVVDGQPVQPLGRGRQRIGAG